MALIKCLFARLPQRSRYLVNTFLTESPLGIVILCLATFVLATSVAWGVFEAVPHIEDEHANLFQAKIFASGRATVRVPPDVDSFFIPSTISLNGNRFAKYPPGYPLLLALGVLINIPWLINSLAAALAVLGVYLVGRDLFDRNTGLLAAGLGALSPMSIMLSGTLLPHSTALATSVFFVWTFVRARQLGSAYRITFAMLAGALIGWTTITRPLTGLAIGSPFVLLLSIDLIRHPIENFRICAAMAVAFAFVFSIWPLFNVIATGSPTTNTYTLLVPYDSVGFGPQFGRGSDGHTLGKAILNTELDLDAFGKMLFGWPNLANLPISWLPIAFGLIPPQRTKREWGLILPALVLILAQMLYWSDGNGLYGPRYYSEAMPFLWIIAARGLITFGSRTWIRRLAKVALPLLIGWGIMFTIFPRFSEGRGVYSISRQDANVITGEHLDHALIFVYSDYWTMYANLSWLNQPDLQGDLILAEDRGWTENNKVIADYPGRKVYYYGHNNSQLSNIRN